MKLAGESRKQNEIIDQIHTGLDDLLDGARVRGGESLWGAEQCQGEKGLTTC